VIPVSFIVVYFKATTKHEEKPPRPEPHMSQRSPHSPKDLIPASGWEKALTGSSRICYKSPTHSLVGHSVTITMPTLGQGPSTLPAINNISYYPILPYQFTNTPVSITPLDLYRSHDKSRNRLNSPPCNPLVKYQLPCLTSDPLNLTLSLLYTVCDTKEIPNVQMMHPLPATRCLTISLQ